MTVSARSWATLLVLALAFSVGTATGAAAQECPGPGPGPRPAPPAPTITLGPFPTASLVDPPVRPPTPTVTVPPAPRATMRLGAAAAPAAPCLPGPDGVLGTADDLVVPFRADTGAGGTGEDGSMTPMLLLGGGLLALGAAFGVCRTARAPRA